MAESLLFDIPEPVMDEDPAVSIHWHQSTDGNLWEVTPVDTILVTDLPVDLTTGKYRWASTTADPAKYHQLRTVSAIGAINPNGLVVSPRVVKDLCEIYVDVRDFGLEPKPGIVFLVHVKTVKLGGIIFDPSEIKRSTDATGILSIFVAKNCSFDISCKSLNIIKRVDTTNKSYINLSALL